MSDISKTNWDLVKKACDARQEADRYGELASAAQLRITDHEIGLMHAAKTPDQAVALKSATPTLKQAFDAMDGRWEKSAEADQLAGQASPELQDTKREFAAAAAVADAARASGDPVAVARTEARLEKISRAGFAKLENFFATHCPADKPPTS